ncbi:MAG: SufS family cysteine desulfurase [Patescibacteria group bacterium]|nr:SufS family cysteine desulfurase [Patescibacteria group bacterium]
MSKISINNVAQYFPILSRKINGNRLVYLDNAATTQKPISVIESLSDFYKNHNANIHRGLHTLSMESSEMYDDAHNLTAELIGAKGMEEIIFTRNTTESINLIAHAWVNKFLKKGDVVVITGMEHHSNFVPWQFFRDSKGIVIKRIPVNDNGLLDLDEYEKILKKYGARVKLVSVVHISNVLGTINPVKEIGEMAHEAGAVFMVDAAQSAARQTIDVDEMGIDFLAASSHKMYGPTGIGFLYGKKRLLEEMDPWMCGGDMISRVTNELFEVNDLPWKFEAGTPNIADGVAFGEAVKFIQELGIEKIIKHEKELVAYSLEQLGRIKGVKVLGSPDIEKRLGVVSFHCDDIHPHDLSSLLNEDGVAIRAGHHCAMPLHIDLGLMASARISLAVYNTKEDIDIFIKSLKNAKKQFV